MKKPNDGVEWSDRELEECKSWVLEDRTMQYLESKIYLSVCLSVCLSDVISFYVSFYKLFYLSCLFVCLSTPVYTTSQKFLNSKILFLFLKKSLLLTNPAFISFKTQQKQ